MSKLVDILGGNVIKSVGEILDNLSTSKEEKLAAKQAMKDLLLKAESEAQEQVSRRWEADMKEHSTFGAYFSYTYLSVTFFS